MKAPLREVKYRFQSEKGVMMEHLECGHEQVVKQDIYGPTNAYRRRCQRCGKPAAPAGKKGEGK